MKHISIKNLYKTWGTNHAVNSVSLEIEKGEMVSLLGPSGCGKTTLLRMIAGFEKETSGEISLRDRRINDVPAQKRNVGIVFQDYAVFPTMNVYDNIAYGLKIKKLAKDKIHDLVLEYLDLVGLKGYEKRMPSQMSGGQQQRIALARALVFNPDVLLLDEPLSNLDAALRLHIRKEIRKIQQKLGITAVFVTHDQEEALSVSDRIYVMRNGHIMQCGTPAEIYQTPENDFVAGFIGKSNILYGTVGSFGENQVFVKVKNNMFIVNCYDCSNYNIGQDVWISLRPQYVRFAENDMKGNSLSGTIQFLEYLGAIIKGEIAIDNGSVLEFEIYSGESIPKTVELGERVNITVNPGDLVMGSKIYGQD